MYNPFLVLVIIKGKVCNKELGNLTNVIVGLTKFNNIDFLYVSTKESQETQEKSFF